jgi:hypothetical protein
MNVVVVAPPQLLYPTQVLSFPEDILFPARCPTNVRAPDVKCSKIPDPIPVLILICHNIKTA